MKQATISILFTPIVFLIAIVMHTSLLGDIDSTKHNLSVSGTGDITATGESEICIFCHTPHNSSPQMPLWNRNNLGQVYTPYTSSTIDGLPGQPTGSSLLCLSCHDGTIALGDLISRDAPIAMTGGLAGRRARLGTDLSDDHPVSIEFTEALAVADGRLKSPSTLTEEVKLDASGMVQCTSCHNPHKDDYGKFLVMSDQRGALCMSCHDAYHEVNSNPHEFSLSNYDGSGNDPWPNTEWTTVRDNSCYNCHTPHAAGGSTLLKYATEEQVCLDCHDGSVAQENVKLPIELPSGHPVGDTTGVHDAAEPILVSQGSRHVECQDCHNSHAVKANPLYDPVSRFIRRTRGITIDGVEIEEITAEYELCFRCHGDTQPFSNTLTNRLVNEPNVRLDYSPDNPSYHPVAAIGKNRKVPSLTLSGREESTIKCTHCHRNNNQDFTSNGGADGPHGSDNSPILYRQYDTTDPAPWSISRYRMCEDCHVLASIVRNDSFTQHGSHIRGSYDEDNMEDPDKGGGTPCNTCHDPHGVRAGGGIGGEHTGTHLINFNTDVVSPNSEGKLYFYDPNPINTVSDPFEGTCSLSCHGKDHVSCSYHNDGNGTSTDSCN